MKATPISELPIETELNHFICHNSGGTLHEPGEKITLAHLALMEECGISQVTLIENEEKVKEFKQKTITKTVNIQDINHDEICPATLFDSERNTIIEYGALIRQPVLSHLQEKGIQQLYCHKDMQELQSFQYEKYKSLLESDVYETISKIRILEHPKEKQKREEEIKRSNQESEKTNFKKIKLNKEIMFGNPSLEISTANLKEGMKNQANLRKKILGSPMKEIVKRTVGPRNETEKKNTLEQYNKWIAKTFEIFTTLKSNRPVSIDSIYELVGEILQVYASDCHYLVNLTNRKISRKNELYVMAHCINVCVISLNIASVLGFSPEQCMEIAIGALLHDIGHILTYRPLFAKAKLDSSEQQKFDQHCIIGVALLKNISSIPISTAYIIFQHHEKMNGSGRILHCQGAKIHDFAKLIAVADKFDHTCEAKTPFNAMASVISMGKSQILDMNYVKGLLVSTSLYPVGSLVLTSNNFVCKVIGTNGINFKQPLVKQICSMSNKQIFELENGQEIDLQANKKVTILKEIFHPLLNRNYSKGF